MKQVIHTTKAPKAIGTYSQAIKSGNTVYISGQIPLDPDSMELISGDFKKQTEQAFANLQAVVEASGGTLSHIVKLNIYLLDMKNFPQVNEVMESLWQKPYPARAVVAVAGLPRQAAIEIDAIMTLGE